MIKSTGKRILRDIQLNSGVALIGGTYSNTEMQQLYLNYVWKSCMFTTAAEGLPEETTISSYELEHPNLIHEFKVSCNVRLPPFADLDKVSRILEERLTTDIPFAARSKFEIKDKG
jgi:hypothetical protein